MRKRPSRVAAARPRRREACWRVIGATARGSGHERAGQPCQDAQCWAVEPGGVLLAALADGAGSATFGEVGAIVATRAAVKALRRGVEARAPGGWEQVMRGALEAAQAAVRAEALEQGYEVGLYATTLLAAAVMPELAAAVQVGDGAIVAGTTGGRLVALTTPQTGEHLNDTMFLTSPDALEAARVVVWRGRLGHLAMLSDGLQMLALSMPRGEPHGPFFRPLFRFVSQTADEVAGRKRLRSFLASQRVRRRTDDDLSLLLAAAVE